MSGFKCPYCNMVMSVSSETNSKQYPSFYSSSGKGSHAYSTTATIHQSCLEINFFKCPNCGQYTVFAKGVGNAVKDVDLYIRPTSSAKQFPEYIREAIRKDYSEACAILKLSPKASATLARRCLQGMIRDFWEINESNLKKAIDNLENKIPAKQWSVIDAVRRLGNIGAHMEKDINLIIEIDPGEAEKLINLIELLLNQWYIDRYEQEQLYNDILSINETKQTERKQTE